MHYVKLLFSYLLKNIFPISCSSRYRASSSSQICTHKLLFVIFGFFCFVFIAIQGKDGVRQTFVFHAFFSARKNGWLGISLIRIYCINQRNGSTSKLPPKKSENFRTQNFSSPPPPQSTKGTAAERVPEEEAPFPLPRLLLKKTFCVLEIPPPKE